MIKRRELPSEGAFEEVERKGRGKGSKGGEEERIAVLLLLLVLLDTQTTQMCVCYVYVIPPDFFFPSRISKQIKNKKYKNVLSPKNTSIGHRKMRSSVDH